MIVTILKALHSENPLNKPFHCTGVLRRILLGQCEIRELDPSILPYFTYFGVPLDQGL